MRLTEKSHEILKEFFDKISNPLAIDASCGNGHDTLALARMGCSVFAFDIQDAAINATSELLNKNAAAEYVTIFKHSHADMASKIGAEYHGKINAAVFNLGWLPGSDKGVITKAESTIKALESLKILLDPSCNIVCIIVYRGHDGGNEEFDAVKSFLHGCSPQVFGDEANPKSPILFVFSMS